MDTLESLEKFMLTDIIAGYDGGSYELKGNLLEQGIIDSLGIMKLVVFMENTFNMKIDDEEIIPENFQCLDCMVEFVVQKSQNK